MLMLDLRITDQDIKALEKVLTFEFDTQRKDILKNLETINIQACPGSGKTTLIAAKLILLSQQWHYKYRGICVLSHPNVAKNEIIKRIEESKIPEAKDLLSYPHFIGTIHEFVNRYLGIPLVKSKGCSIHQIDDEHCVSYMENNLGRRTKSYLNKKKNASLYSFSLKIEENKIRCNIPTFDKKSSTCSYNDLIRVRKEAMEKGLFFHNDFFIFDEKLLLDNPETAYIIQTRFPLVITDEMQDTQAHQDGLLQKIFSTEGAQTVVQKFGDPDQAIFYGTGGGEAAESDEDMSYKIKTSHRFHNDIAAKIKGLSYAELDLVSQRQREDEESSNKQHTIFIYDNNSIDQVLPEFAKVCRSCFEDTRGRIIKAVGAVGKINEGKITIPTYERQYSKDKNPKKLKMSTFIDAVYFVQNQKMGDISSNYHILMDAFLTLLYKAGTKDAQGKYFTKTRLKETLQEEGKWNKFQMIMTHLLFMDKTIEENYWEKIKKDLCVLFELNMQDNNIEAYLQYYSKSLDKKGDFDQEASTNIFTYDGVDIELSTIHGVKGETHDATLVLETFYKAADVKQMLGYMVEPSKERLKKNQKKFMKQLYIAVSRPKHLLCLAMHQDNIKDKQRTSLAAAGWKVVDISNKKG